ncbi:hypothetical protein [Noviherbaspirillum aridicola]|uniref:Uncharacterized protein n=1 Tax=Noviherbaspirillum aridicola TaxID=2849687 RepID=A0ABQ4QA20_9BURK|nr:hypothetical protein [Noviherbaspirillum aridicola]GIZ53912.1 hypothetical protein NCCP691_39260 [Noviherbaspirillum aridicola]
MKAQRYIVQVKSEAEGKLVIETPEGKEETYYLNPVRTMRLDVEKLQVHRGGSQIHLLNEDLPAPPNLSLYVLGTASLEGRSISIIGEPDNKTRRLTIAFRTLDIEGRERREDWSRKYDKPVRFTGATVGFLRSDWETGNDNEWFVECEVSPDMLDEIASAVSSKSLRRMSVGLTLSGIYADENWAPPSARTDWFLRPNREDNTVENPEMAHGEVTSINLSLADADLRPQQDQEEDAELPADDTPAVLTSAIEPNVSVSNIDALTTNIEKLRVTLKWVGGFIAFFLMILAFR